MGLATIVTAAMRNVSWGHLADIARQYGPDVIRMIKERLQKGSAPEQEMSLPEDNFEERIRELEDAVVKQEEIIEQQNRSIALLEENGKTLQARLNIFIIISSLSALLSFILLFLFLRR